MNKEVQLWPTKPPLSGAQLFQDFIDCFGVKIASVLTYRPECGARYCEPENCEINEPLLLKALAIAKDELLSCMAQCYDAPYPCDHKSLHTQLFLAAEILQIGCEKDFGLDDKIASSRGWLKDLRDGKCWVGGVQPCCKPASIDYGQPVCEIACNPCRELTAETLDAYCGDLGDLCVSGKGKEKFGNKGCPECGKSKCDQGCC